MSETTSNEVASSSKSKGSTIRGSSGSVKFEMQRFDGIINFGLWQRRMRGVLVQQGLSKALLGIENKPKDMSDEDWKDIDERAMYSIELHISDEIMFNSMEETTAKGLWEKLQSLYLGKNLSNKLFLNIKIYDLKMEEGTDVREHLSVFNRLISDLLRVDAKFDDEDKSLLLLKSLPNSFEHFVTTPHVWKNYPQV